MSPRSAILYQAQALPPLDDITAFTASQWIYPWSEPVRFNVIHVSQIVSGLTWNPQQPLPPTSPWFANLSEPVRLPIGLRPWYQQFECNDAIPNPEPEHFADAWIPSFTLPVWFLPGLRAWYQQALFQPPRMLPTPNVSVTLAATETNADVFLAGVDVAESGSASTPAGASVTITEIPAIDGAGMSIREP